MMKPLPKAMRGIEADRDAAWGRAFDALRAGPSHPRACSAGPPSAFQQSRELHERHKREEAVIRAVLRGARAARRPVSRPPPRPRERGALVASGRDGTERDDGSGSDDGGGGDPPPSRLGARVLERERGMASS